MKSYFRPEIEAMAGYTPGEQPKLLNLLKLNTNENPYPPSPRVAEALRECDWTRLRLYPDPLADALRDEFAGTLGFERKNVIAGNGSDDILTMVFRAFTDPERAVACVEPTYSLYPVLAEMQGAPIRRIALQGEGFELPSDLLEQAEGANLLVIARPNAPTGNSFPLETMRRYCREFEGVVLFDEAYADFADDNCLELAREFPNVLVSRTFSKSYSLAGLRLGFAVGNPELIEGLFKLKDSYNIDLLAQVAGAAAWKDREYHRDCCARIKESRKALADELTKIGFSVVPSQTNFLFAAPPDRDGAGCFRRLREQAIIVRYFPGPVTGAYLRITIGTPEQMTRLVEALRGMYR